MKLSTALLIVNATALHAFSPSSVMKARRLRQSSSTARYFLDTSKDKSKTPESKNPISDIQSYIVAPEPVGVSTVTGTCLVSGKVSPDIFYLLNSEDSAFSFDKIVAISPDVASMKKQLLTRQARYTGLLGKLDYETASLLPTSALLEEASSWIVVVDSIADLNLIAQCAGKVENVAVLYVAPSRDGIEAASEALKAANPNASLVIVDQDAVTETPIDEFEETKPPLPLMYYQQYGSSSVSESISDPAFFKEEATRMVTECLQLQAACGKTLELTLVENDTMSETSASQTPQQLFPKLIKGLRQAGYERPQEIDHMLRFGVSDYQKEIEGFEKENPTAKNGVVHTNAWWEDPEFQKMVKQSSLRQEELIAANREREARHALASEEEKFA